jgi:hypothetical protein
MADKKSSYVEDIRILKLEKTKGVLSRESR